MKNISKYMAIIFAFVCSLSCSLQEIESPVNGKHDSVEFIVRPTSFTGYSLSKTSTKALSVTEMTEVERKVASAFFLVFDGAGNRLIFDNLEVSNNSIPTQKLLTDFGGNNDVTVCFLANVTEEYASSLEKVSDLSTKPLSLTYASHSDAGYIGIPIVDVKGTPADLSDDEMCFPMFGMVSCAMNNLESNKVIIEMKRLFAKISVNINLDLQKGGEVEVREAYLELNRYAVKNLPNKIKLTESKEELEGEVILHESNWVRDASSFIPETATTVTAVLGNDSDPTNGYNIQFYVPEYILLPDPDMVEAAKEQSPEEQERMKPLLVAEGTFPLALEIKGMFYSVQGDDIEMTYSIFLGENSFDSFSHFRNIMYINNMTIRGAAIVDNRVEMKYAGFRVGFPHSVQMDAHFNVRPLRLQFTNEFTEGLAEGLYSHGEIKIEVIKSKDTGRDPNSWIALERPIKSEISKNPKYSIGYTIKGKPAPYPTKRRYFTTGLISELESQKKNSADDPSAGHVVTFRTDEPNALDGSIITWVYVDEYSTQSADPENNFRQDTLAVTFTMDGSSEGVTKKYLVRQSPIYPLTKRLNALQNRKYGIELFEEYTMDYDSKEHYDSEENLGFHTDKNGIAWGLEGISLSRNNPAIFLDEPTFNPGDDTHQYLRSYFETGIKLGDESYNLIQTIIKPSVSEKIEQQIERLNSYYDFYTEYDKNYVSNLNSVYTKDYEGFLMNVEIIHTLLSNFSGNTSAKLNEMILDETPLSAIAYCYNKNKRNADGEVISKNSDGSLNISNFHWYAPAIEEIEEIMQLSYDAGEGRWLNENFATFAENFYWSCQPAFLNNDIRIDYNAKTKWKINGTGFLGNVNSTITLSGSLIANGFGNYLEEDATRARSTLYDVQNQKSIESFSQHKTKVLKITGTFNPTIHDHTSNAYLLNANTVAKDLVNPLYWAYTGQYFSSLSDHLKNVSWGQTGEFPTGDTPVRGDGNLERKDVRRVRCVYYDHNYTKATRQEVSDWNLQGKKGYETKFSR